MTLEQIKQLTIDDFTIRNVEVWAAIDALPIPEHQQLAETHPWQDENSISNGLWGLLEEKKKAALCQCLRAKLTRFEIQLLADVLLVDRDITWDNLHHIIGRLTE